MYNGRLEMPQNYVEVKGIITALRPIAHGEPPNEKPKYVEQNGERILKKPKRDNTRRLRRVTVCVHGSFVEVPIVSSNHITHLFRVLMVRDLLGRAGLDEDRLTELGEKHKDLYYLLFSGGHLEKVENGAKSSVSKLKALFPTVESVVDAFYPVGLFGGAVTWFGNVILESRVGVDHLWPVVSEVMELFGYGPDTLAEFGVWGVLPSLVHLQQVKPLRFVKTDEVAVRAHLHDLPAESPDGEGLAEAGEGDAEDDDRRNILRVEYLPAGMRLLHTLYVEVGTEEETALALSALKYLTEDLLATHPFLGGLVKRGFGLVSAKYAFPDRWGSREVKKEIYLEYLEKAKGRVADALARLLGQ